MSSVIQSSALSASIADSHCSPFAIIVVIQQVGGIKLFSKLDQKAVHDAAIDCIALGAIISAAAAIGAVDPYERRKTKAAAQSLLRFVLAAGLTAFAICALTLIFFGTIHALLATAFGLATLMAIIVSRRVGIGPWGTVAFAITIVAAVVSMIAMEPRVLTLDLTLSFASASGPESLVPITQQILNDGNWAGSGAGTFGALVPIYRDIDRSVAGSAAPTAAAAIAVELGRPALWFAVIAAFVALLVLLRGTLSRGRDSFYPAAGAGCLVTAALLAFCNAGALNTSTSIIVATTVGIAIVHSKSRTAS